MKPKSFRAGTAVRIHWIDSTGAAGWVPLLANQLTIKPEKIITQAYVIENTGESLTVTHTFGEHAHTVLAPLTIPWGCIQMVEVLHQDAHYPFPEETPSEAVA